MMPALKGSVHNPFAIPLPTPARAMLTTHHDYQEQVAVLTLQDTNAEAEEEDVDADTGHSEDQKPRLESKFFYSVPLYLQPDYSILLKGKNWAPKNEQETISDLKLQLKKAYNIIQIKQAINNHANVQLVLWDLHLVELNSQLQAKEKRGSEQRKLISTTKARFLTSPKFMEAKRKMEDENAEMVEKKIEAATQWDL
ncbi:hypothetical protein FRB94_012474 [Tulasnella sp. JGI-2019a]|nr:hypothetical protein FRB94_012474 [Tulasnella sp. JGI-2019a]